ncbi:MAG TPA: hypothetical protein DCS66_01550 [Flavobacteriaceae bacterium]|nr:hypothetical protein [Flavobacteriaceae bacterium]
MIAVYYFLNKPAGSGDESLFINDIHFISENGWFLAIKKGISIPYMLIVYPISKMVSGAIVLRLVNLFLFLGLVSYFKFHVKIKSVDFYFLLMFFFSSLGYFLVGTNDTLFIVAMAIFLAESHFLIQEKTSRNITLWCISLILTFFTRQLFIPFIPIVALVFFLLLKQKKVTFKKLLIPFLVFLGFVALNYPSISSNGKLSYDSKNPPEGVTATWAQRQYLAQIWVNEGKIKNYNHPTWEQTDQYLVENGEGSLPSSVWSSLTFDLELTLKEFVKDFIYIIQYSLRSMGLMVLITLFLGLKYLAKGFKLNDGTLIPIILLLSATIFSVVIISFIELRWLASVFIATILYYQLKSERNEISKLWVSANFCFITLLCLYGSYGLLLKF